MKVTKIFIILLFSLLFISLATAITITQINPSGDITTSEPYINISYNVTIDDLQELKFNWDGTNTTLYDDSLVLFYNFDNRSALGENDTHVKDLSKYGNNGSVVGGVLNNSAGHYFGGAKFSEDYNNITGVSSSINMNDNLTFCSWLNLYSYNSVDQYGTIFIQNRTGLYSFHLVAPTKSQQYPYIEMVLKNSTGTSIYNHGHYSLPRLNYFFHYCFTYDSSVGSMTYVNGLLVDSDSPINSGVLFDNQLSNWAIGYKGSGYKSFNGSIDDVMIFNRSLSLDEISQLYQSQLTKYDSENWTFYSNQTLSNLNSTFTTDDFNYNLCLYNSTTEVCSSTRTITQTIPIKNLFSNFTSSIGNIRSDFYGVNNYLKFFAENSLNMDTDGDGLYDDGYNNYTEHRNAFLNTNMGMYRQRAYLNTIYSNNTELFDIYVSAPDELRKISDEVKFTFDNNISMIIVLEQMPTFLQNRTSGYCNSSSWSSCSSNNLTAHSNMIIHFLNNVTNYGQYKNILVEIKNEPYRSEWLNNLTTDDVIKGIEYVKEYNSTYFAIKNNANLSWVPVGGPAGHVPYWNMTKTFLSNASEYGYGMDFISTHRYGDWSPSKFLISADYLVNDYNILVSNCSLYGVNCSRIIFSEWGDTNYTIKNTTSLKYIHSTETAYGYLSTLNTAPNNISMVIWDWSEDEPYINSTGGSKRAEYPAKWNMFLQSNMYDGLDGYDHFDVTYNVTKNFAHLCPAGGTVYQSSSDDDTLKTVSCKDGDKYNVIVINTGTESRNVSLDTEGLITTLTNYETGEKYYGNSPIELGIMDSYDILYLTYDSTVIDGLVLKVRLNSNNGTIAYDSSGNNNHGTIVGATWQNDGIYRTLVNGVDYTLNTATGLLTLSSEYLYGWIEVGWEYVYDEGLCVTTIPDIRDKYGLFVTGLIAFISIIGTLVGVIWLVLYVRKLFDKDTGLQSISA